MSDRSSSDAGASDAPVTPASVMRDIAASLAPPTIPVIDCSRTPRSGAAVAPFPFTPAAFYRTFVDASVPVLFRKACTHLPAFTRWADRNYIKQKLGDAKFPVALTPNGLADAIISMELPADKKKKEPADGNKSSSSSSSDDDGDDKKQPKLFMRRVFMEGAEEQMDCAHFFAMLDEQHRPGIAKQQKIIAYMQAQDDCLCDVKAFRNLIPDLLDLRGGGSGTATAAAAATAASSVDAEFHAAAAEKPSSNTKSDDNHDDEEEEEAENPAESESAEVRRTVDSPQRRLNKLLAQRCSVFRFFAEALGRFPDGADATNIFMGTDESLTSLHQDLYENAYAVISGTKTFKIVPPTDCYVRGMEKVKAKAGRWVYSAQHEDPAKRLVARMFEEWEIDEQPWVDFEEAKVRANGGHVYTIDVEAGDVLFLPAMWFHEVGQRCDPSDDAMGACKPVIAVNCWFEHVPFGQRFQLQRLMKTVMGHVDGE